MRVNVIHESYCTVSIIDLQLDLRTQRERVSLVWNTSQNALEEVVCVARRGGTSWAPVWSYTHKPHRGDTSSRW